MVKNCTLLLVAWSSLCGCALFRPAPPMGLMVEMKQTTLTCDEFGELLLVSVFDVKNPNDFDVQVVEIERALRLESKPLKIQSVASSRKIPARGQVSFSARTTIRGQEIVRALKSLPEDMNVKAFFQLSLRTNQRELDPSEWFTGEWAGEVPVMLAPTLSFEGIDKKSLSALQADVNILLALHNPNVFDINLRSLSIGLTVNDLSFGHIEEEELERLIPGGETTQIKIAQSYRLANEGSEIFEVLSHSKSLNVSVVGQAILAIDSPLSPVPVSLSTTGQDQSD